MKLWDHIKGYFPVDKMLLNIFTKGWIIVLEEHLSISSNKESKPEVFFIIFDEVYSWEYFISTYFITLFRKK